MFTIPRTYCYRALKLVPTIHLVTLLMQTSGLPRELDIDVSLESCDVIRLLCALAAQEAT